MGGRSNQTLSLCSESLQTAVSEEAGILVNLQYEQQVLADTPTGDLSEPFRSQYGWHVLEVTDRREQDMSQEARRRMAMQILHQRRFDEELQEWQKELRDEAFVEVRI